MDSIDHLKRIFTWKKKLLINGVVYKVHGEIEHPYFNQTENGFELEICFLVTAIIPPSNAKQRQIERTYAIGGKIEVNLNRGILNFINTEEPKWQVNNYPGSIFDEHVYNYFTMLILNHSIQVLVNNPQNISSPIIQVLRNMETENTDTFKVDFNNACLHVLQVINKNSYTLKIVSSEEDNPDKYINAFIGVINIMAKGLVNVVDNLKNQKEN